MRFISRGKIPQKATIGSACYDLFAAKSVVLQANATRLVETNLGFSFPKTYVAKIFPRSILSLRLIHVGGGIVDADYRGNIRVILTNLSNSRVEFNAGDRIAQVLFQKIRTLFLKTFWALMIIWPKDYWTFLVKMSVFELFYEYGQRKEKIPLTGDVKQWT